LLLATVFPLRKINDPRSAYMLEKVLNDEDFDVRWKAAEALTAMGYKTVK